MNFFQAQDQARKQTRWLLFFFFLAVSSLVLITNICVAVFFLYSNPDYSLQSHAEIGGASGNVLLWLEGLFQALGWKKFTLTSLLVCSVIGMAMGFKWMSLREGGRVVAESLGGRVILPNTAQPQEKRLLNIVEEIALASGTPVPQVYLLEREAGINAFAAGLSPEDAVIGVTQGCLNYFNRDQLQGVIAHEFSHILNGDMRLNMKLLAILHGILMIGESGRTFMRMTSRRGYSYGHRHRNNGLSSGLFLFGLCLWIIGFLGQFFGSLIKAAVSRQREFLADASAVQFTRNATGIGEALSIIGGASEHSHVNHNGAHEVAHLFFSSASFRRSHLFLSAFATHPPLEDRIKRVLPQWRGRFLKAEPDQYGVASENTSSFSNAGSSARNDTDVSSLSDEKQAQVEHTPIEFVSALNAQQDGLAENIKDGAGHAKNTKGERGSIDFKTVSLEERVPESDRPSRDVLFNSARAKVHEPLDASILVLALLLGDDETSRSLKLKVVQNRQQKWLPEVQKSYALIKQLSGQDKLAIAELAIPSLKTLSLNQYKRVRVMLTEVIQADAKVDLFEWLIFQLLKQYCDRHFGLAKPDKPKYKKVQQLAKCYEIVLSRVVHYGVDEPGQTGLDRDDTADIPKDKQRAFDMGSNAAGIYTINLLALDQCKDTRFTRAVHELSMAYPLLKPRLIKGLIKAVQSDAHVNDHERYVITGIAAIMDCPLIGLDEVVNN